MSQWAQQCCIMRPSSDKPSQLRVDCVTFAECSDSTHCCMGGRGSGMFGVCGQRSMCMMAAVPHCSESLHSWQTSVIRFVQCHKKKTDLVSLKRILNLDWNNLWFKHASLPKKAEGSSSQRRRCFDSISTRVGHFKKHDLTSQVKPSTKNLMLYKIETDWSYATASSPAIRCGFHQLPR